MAKKNSWRRSLFALVPAAACTALGAPAAAQVLWDNGGANTYNGFCDANAVTCGSSGWTIYDDFALSGAATVTGLTYGTYFDEGSSSYASTNYSIWANYPVDNFGSGPLFSGTMVGSIASSGDAFTISLSGLNIALGAGTYWLGLQNNTNGGDNSSYAGSGGSLLGAAAQGDNGGNFYNPSTPDAAFTIEGERAASPTPEPASWALMLGGFGLVGGALRSRSKAMISFG